MAGAIQFHASMARSISTISFASTSGLRRSCSLTRLGFVIPRMRQRLGSLSCGAAPINWEGMIELEAREASTPIDLCEDLDWERCVDALRREALRMTEREKVLKNRASPRVAISGGNYNGEQWDYKEAVMELRRKASLQAAEELAKQIKPSDYTYTVSRIAQDILNDCELLQSKENGSAGDGSTRSAAAVFFLAGLYEIFNSYAIAAETIEAQAQHQVPSWLPPAVLGFPVASYFIFSFYRDQVNPQAKLTDFFFALAAIFIIGNLITSVTLGNEKTQFYK